MKGAHSSAPVLGRNFHRVQDVDNTDEKPCEGPQVSHAVAGLCFSLLAGSKGCLISLVVR